MNYRKEDLPKNVTSFVSKWGGVYTDQRQTAFWKEFRKAANAYANVQAQRIQELDKQLSELKKQKEAMIAGLHEIYANPYNTTECYYTIRDLKKIVPELDPKEGDLKDYQ